VSHKIQRQRQETVCEVEYAVEFLSNLKRNQQNNKYVTSYLAT